MAGLALSIKSSPTGRDFAAVFGSMAASYGNMKQLFKNISANVIYPHFKSQFQSEGASGETGRWAPLSAEYAKRKKRKFGNKKILVASGTMKISLTGARPSDGIREVSQHHVKYGSNIPYAIYHQTGARGRGRSGAIGQLPRRPMWDPTSQNLQKAVTDQVRLWNRDELNRARSRLGSVGAGIK